MNPQVCRVVVATLSAVVAAISPVAQAADPLPSWNEGASKQAI